MTVSETLKQTWRAVIAEASQAEGYYHRRIPVVCAWPVHAGIHRPSDARILILETESKALQAFHLKDETKGYSIDIGPDETGRAGRATIRIQEASQEYRQIFTVFCTDVLECWTPHAGASASLKSLSARLARWKKFFQRGTQLGLNREDYVGLYGELSFIEAGLSAGVGGPVLVNGWQAPLGTNQDFLFGPFAVEIKSTTGNEIDKVRITNARQLDSTGLQSLFLARFAFDFRQGTGRTLAQLVAALQAALSTISTETLSIFNDRLLDAGYLDGVPGEFDAWGFTPRQTDFFTVVEGFPRLLESDLPAGISEPSYTLNLSTAAPFKTTEANLWSVIPKTYV